VRVYQSGFAVKVFADKGLSLYNMAGIVKIVVNVYAAGKGATSYKCLLFGG
jgi:hypothetical protein